MKKKEKKMKKKVRHKPYPLETKTRPIQRKKGDIKPNPSRVKLRSKLAKRVEHLHKVRGKKKRKEKVRQI